MSLIYILLILLAFLSYSKRHFSLFIKLFVTLVSGGFAIFPETILKVTDCLLILLVLISIFEFSRGRHFFSCKNDKIALFTLLLLFYFFLIGVYTVLSGKESFLYAFKVWRMDLFYLYYFVFRNVPAKSLKASFKFLFVMTTIAGIFYILQFVGVYGILQKSDLMADSNRYVDGISRYTNTPILTIPILLYLFYGKIRNNRTLWVIFYLALFIMPMIRGAIIAFAISNIVYLVAVHKFKKMRNVIVYFLLAFILFYPVLEYRFQGDDNRVSTMEDIRLVQNIDYNNIDLNSGGSFYYRIAVFLERWHYLIDESQLFFGVGSIHEESPHNIFILNVGKSIYLNRNAMIDTNDIAFVTHLFRYGLIYFILFVMLIYFYIRHLFKYRNVMTGAIGFMTLLIIVIQSLGSDGFSIYFVMLIPIVLSGLCISDKSENYGTCRNSNIEL